MFVCKNYTCLRRAYTKYLQIFRVSARQTRVVFAQNYFLDTLEMRGTNLYATHIKNHAINVTMLGVLKAQCICIMKVAHFANCVVTSTASGIS